MTLAQQFPDISATIRSKNSVGLKSSRSANAMQSLGYTEADAITQYYEGEFRRWHIKFLFITAGAFGIVSFILIKALMIYNLIVVQ
jgi:hypothetical protein